MSLPTRLYKYEPYSAQSLQNLKNQVIYFGSPLNFNDPYDCALSPRIKEPSNTEVETFRRHYLAKQDLEENVRLEFENSTTESLRAMLLRTGHDALNKAISDFLSRRGVSCFSEKVDNLLMWSHYGEHCKGFCLEFDSSKQPFEKISKVRYEQFMPEFNVVPMLCDDDFDQVLNLYCTKALDWAYEHEWRGVHDKAGTAFSYPNDALTGVYIGPDMPFAAFEIIALILSGQNEHAQLWQGTRSKSRFAVEFQPVTYTSYLEAKRRGLLGEKET